MFASKNGPKVLFDLNKETIFIITILILYFWNNYFKLALKYYPEGLQRGFPHSVRTLCTNFKKSGRETKKTFTYFYFHVLNKDAVFIMELYKLLTIGKKSTRVIYLYRSFAAWFAILFVNFLEKFKKSLK